MDEIAAKSKVRKDIQKNKVFFHILLVFVLFIAYRVAAGYLSLVMLALIISVLFKPVYDFLLKKFWNKPSIATVLTLFIMIIAVLGPLITVVTITVGQAQTFIQDVNSYLEGREYSYETIAQEIDERTSFLPFIDFQQEDIVKRLNEAETNIRENSSRYLQSISSFLGGQVVVAGLVLSDRITKFFVFLFFLVGIIPNVDRLIAYIKSLSPFHDEIDDLYLRRVIGMSNSMIKGTFLIAIVAGVVQGIFFWIAGVEYVTFWVLVMIFLSIIPVGAGIVAWPVGIVLIAFGNVWQGVLVILGFMIVVANIDNLLRPRLVPKDAHLHPLLVLLGVFGGLNMFGALGIIYGPVIMILLMTTLEIYRDFYKPHPIIEPETEE